MITCIIRTTLKERDLQQGFPDVSPYIIYDDLDEFIVIASSGTFTSRVHVSNVF